MRILGETHVGSVRTNNQDCYACKILPSGLAYGVVCDGMGGENGGQVASGLALKIICDRLEAELRPELSDDATLQLLKEAFQEANWRVHQQAEKELSLRGMGTTAIAAVLADGGVCLAHVGDSRIYRIDLANFTATCITRDHTVVRMLMDRGEITAEEALQHPQRHYITRAVGVSTQLEVDLFTRRLEKEEVLLLCSDGLYNYIDEETLPALVQRCLQENSAACLIEEANKGGGGDNITAVILVPGTGGNENG